jgi:hypothetical protein
VTVHVAGAVVLEPSVTSNAFTNPEKIVMLETATVATTLRLMKERRVRLLDGEF